MIPTYTYAIKEEIIQTCFGNNLIIALINNSTLGITDTPTGSELEARRNFTMTDVFDFELTVTNGYARYIVPAIDVDVVIVDTELSRADITASFTASGGDMPEFSHIVVIANADIIGADPILNGNNRGNTIGTIVFIEPVDNAGVPLTITNGTTFEYDFALLTSSELV